MLAIAAGAPVMSLLAMSNCSSVTAAMTTSATNDGPNATLSRSRAWRGPAARLSTTNVSPLAQAARARDAHPRAARITTAPVRNAARRTTAEVAQGPASSERSWTGAAGRTWGNRWAAWAGRPAGPGRKSRRRTDRAGSRRTARDIPGAAAVARAVAAPAAEAGPRGA